jgi:hypothetical protein
MYGKLQFAGILSDSEIVPQTKVRGTFLPYINLESALRFKNEETRPKISARVSVFKANLKFYFLLLFSTRRCGRISFDKIGRDADFHPLLMRMFNSQHQGFDRPPTDIAAR